MRLHTVLTAAIALTCVSALPACGAAPQSPGSAKHASGASSGGALSVVVGARANTPAPDVTGSTVEEREEAVTQGARFSLVVADGAPYLAMETQLTAADASTGQGKRSVQQVDKAIRSARARTAQSDLLTALALAADRVAHVPGLRTIVVQDSGLSTAGLINFTKRGMFDADPAQVADAVADANRLPDLQGVLVVFQGLGETASPQQPLDPVRKAQLQQIWQTLASRAGAIDVRVEPVGRVKPTTVGLPPVSPVTPPAFASCSGNTLKLQGGPLAFRPGSPELVDPDAAQDALRPVAERIDGEGLVAKVSGTYSAEGDRALRQRLSDERAQTVANMLSRLGVPGSQLRVKGLGSNFLHYVPDRTAGGTLVPAAAARNRFVTVSSSKNGVRVACETP